MDNEQKPMSSKEKLELALWLIERHDNLRASASSRAAMVISADAILLAGTTFIIDKGISIYLTFDMQAIMYLISAAIAILLVLISIFHASNTIVFVWRSTRNTVKIKDLPKALYFFPSDTVAEFKEYRKFEEVFLSSTIDDMVTRALSELMHIIHAHHKRYKSLRMSIRFFLVAIIPFVICLVLLIVNFLM